jgi:excisionase family DNA binding protein
VDFVLAALPAPASAAILPRMADEPPLFLTPPAVAEMLGISAEKVLTWVRNGDLRAVNVATRLGGRPLWRIRRTDLEAFLAARENPPRVERSPRRRPRCDPNLIEYF